MSAAPTGLQVTNLFSNAILGRLEQLRLNARTHLTNRRRGEHSSGHSGSSTDFSDYRDYVPGDDVRFVDWNVFARLHRPYLKLFHQEEELHLSVLVDASASMACEGKLERACQLAGAFAVMGLFGAERVSVHAFNGAGLQRIGPCRGRASLGRIFAFLEGLSAGGEATIDGAVSRFLGQYAGRGVCLLLSDFLTPGDLRASFNRLRGSGQDIHAVQILAPSELAPDAQGDLRLVDSETGAGLDVSCHADLLALYHQYREALTRDLDTLCRQRGGRFLPICSDDDLGDILFERMRRRGWLR